MRASLGQPIIIENVAGANGSIGVGRVARAAPDGHTLVIGQWNTFVANGALYALQYHLQNDFEPIALLTETPLLVTAKKAMPANDLKEFIAWLKANPNKATQGHSGIGSAGHVETQARATRAKTGRLKALRLAKEAQAQTEQPAPKQPKRRPARREK
jgi:tripartite-type tricarboxylate transporter receptor subunit TctC